MSYLSVFDLFQDQVANIVLSVSDCRPKAVIVAFVAVGDVLFLLGEPPEPPDPLGLLGVTVTVSDIFNT